MIPHDAFNVHHKLLNMYDIAGRNAGLTQRWNVFGARGGKLFSPPLITTVDKDFLASQVPHSKEFTLQAF